MPGTIPHTAGRRNHISGHLPRRPRTSRDILGHLADLHCFCPQTAPSTNPEPETDLGNDNLRAALQHVGLQPDDLAQIVEVDVKTVRRWLSGRPPYPRHRGRIARALDTTEHELWPELATTPPRRPSEAASDLLGAHPASHDPAGPDWHALMRAATERIELLDETLIHILETEGVVDLLAHKAAEGCEIRILIAESATGSAQAKARTAGATSISTRPSRRTTTSVRPRSSGRPGWTPTSEPVSFSNP